MKYYPVMCMMGEDKVKDRDPLSYEEIKKAIDKPIRSCDEELKIKPYRDHYALFLGNEKLEEGTYQEMESDKKDYYFKVSYLPTGLLDNEARKSITVLASNKQNALKEARNRIGSKPKDLRIESR